MRQSTLALVLLTVAVGVGLFLVKYRVQSLEAQLQSLNRDIAQDRKRIHVLRAEWSHFNEPDRLRVLAGRHLDMMPVQLEQVVERDRMEEKLPERLETLSDQLAAESGDNAGKEFRP
tara:strand:- start:47 stop:397 length:351 start_codon:yes stop_codon:yes gene_type:complete